MLLGEGVCYNRCVLLTKLCWLRSCFILNSKAKFACYSRYLLISYFCISFPYNEKDIFFGWAWPCPSEQDPVFPTVSLSQQETSISLLSLSLRGQTEWKPQSQKTNQTITLSNSMKLWAMPCRDIQDGWVMVESSDKMWSTGEGIGKPLQYSWERHEHYEKAKR